MFEHKSSSLKILREFAQLSTESSMNFYFPRRKIMRESKYENVRWLFLKRPSFSISTKYVLLRKIKHFHLKWVSLYLWNKTNLKWEQRSSKMLRFVLRSLHLFYHRKDTRHAKRKLWKCERKSREVEKPWLNWKVLIMCIVHCTKWMIHRKTGNHSPASRDLDHQPKYGYGENFRRW